MTECWRTTTGRFGAQRNDINVMLGAGQNSLWNTDQLLQVQKERTVWPTGEPSWHCPSILTQNEFVIWGERYTAFTPEPREGTSQRWDTRARIIPHGVWEGKTKHLRFSLISSYVLSGLPRLWVLHPDTRFPSALYNGRGGGFLLKWSSLVQGHTTLNAPDLVWSGPACRSLLLTFIILLLSKGRIKISSIKKPIH